MDHSYRQDLSGVCSETILLIEDEAFVRNVASAVLKSAGYAVVTCRTTREATEAYERRPEGIDLVLTDIILPEENGRDFVKRLAKIDPMLKFLLMTGYSDQMDISELEDSSAELLCKPFSAAALLQKVREALDQRCHYAPMAQAVHARLR